MRSDYDEFHVRDDEEKEVGTEEGAEGDDAEDEEADDSDWSEDEEGL